MCWKVPKMPTMPTVATTAKELVPQTESKAPDSPVFGDGLLTPGLKKGTQALKIEQDVTKKSYSPTNYY